MLPLPPPTDVLEANPQFATIYKHLTTELLTHDGSRKSKSKDEEEIHHKLNEARAAAVKHTILLHALEELALATDPAKRPSGLPQRHRGGTVSSNNSEQQSPTTPLALPSEMRDLSLTISNYLLASLDRSTRQSLPADTNELMWPEIEQFRAKLPAITPVLSQYLIDLESSLATTSSILLHPNSHQSPSTRSSVTLSDILSDAHDTVTSVSTTALPTALTNLLTSLTSVSQKHTSVLSTTVRHLEQHIHGTQARHTSARANYLASVSRGVELKAEIMRMEAEKSVYADQDVVEWMEEELGRLDVEERRVRRVEGELSGLVGEYEEAGRGVVGRAGLEGRIGDRQVEEVGEEVFRVLGQRYKEVEDEIQEVKRDIERLEGRVWRGR